MNENMIDTPVEMSVGEILRNARTTGRRKREISTIAKQLCIREEFLTALEEGKYAEIPEPVYVLGFARNYAMELGLDPEEIVTKIKREMGLIADCVTDTDDVAENTSAKCVVANDVPKFAAIRSRVMSFIRRYWKWLVGAIAAVVAVVIVMIVLLMPEPVVVDASSPAAAAATVVMEDSEPKYAVEVRERFGLDNRENAKIIIQATAESWVKVEDGRGKTVFSRVLVPGDVYYVPDGKRYKATFGNAGGIDAWVNGKLAPKIGADHVRKSGIVLTAEGLMGDTTKK